MLAGALFHAWGPTDGFGPPAYNLYICGRSNWNLPTSGNANPVARFPHLWPNLTMWTRCKVCDACQTAPATVETDAGFFLCDDCEPVVDVAFQEFELPSVSPMND